MILAYVKSYPSDLTHCRRWPEEALPEGVPLVAHAGQAGRVPEPHDAAGSGRPLVVAASE